MPEFRYEEREHRYFLDDEEIPGVTRIMEEMGLTNNRWATRDSAEKGTAIHAACMYVLDGTYDEEGTHPEIIPYVRTFKKFLYDNKFKLTGYEEPMYSPKLGIAGKPDLWGKILGKWDPVLFEIKTGAVPKLVGIQLGLYDFMISERGQRLSGRKVIDLEPDDYSLPDYSEAEWMRYSVQAVSLWKLRKGHGLLAA